MNKLTIKGEEIPFKTGIYLLNNNKTIVQIKSLEGGTKNTVRIIDKFVFDKTPAPIIEDIAVLKGSCFILGADKFVYRLTFVGHAPKFKKVDFSRSMEIPKSFNKRLSKMYNVKNFDVSREVLFTKEIYTKASYAESISSFNLTRLVKENWRGEYQTRIN